MAKARRTAAPRRVKARSMSASAPRPKSGSKRSTAKRVAGAYVGLKAAQATRPRGPGAPGPPVKLIVAHHVISKHRKRVRAARALRASQSPPKALRPNRGGPGPGFVAVPRSTGPRRPRPSGSPSRGAHPPRGPGGRGISKATGSKRFTSKAMWRWAFATHQPWAHREAHRTMAARGGVKAAYRSLPVRKSRPTGRTTR